MSSNDGSGEKNKNADNILQILEEAGVATESLVEKRHAFWDTQVSRINFRMQFIILFSRLFLPPLSTDHYTSNFLICLS